MSNGIQKIRTYLGTAEIRWICNGRSRFRAAFYGPKLDIQGKKCIYVKILWSLYMEHVPCWETTCTISIGWRPYIIPPAVTRHYESSLVKLFESFPAQSRLKSFVQDYAEIFAELALMLQLTAAPKVASHGEATLHMLVVGSRKLKTKFQLGRRKM